MKIIQNLPNWVISNQSPSFYETEGGTVLEQTAIMYKKIQEIIDDYNTRDENINTKVDDFIQTTEENQRAFEIAINQVIHDFTTLAELKLKEQDTQIDNAVDYMSTSLKETTSEVLMELVESEQIALKLVYDETTEELNIVGAILGGAE